MKKRNIDLLAEQGKKVIDNKHGDMSITEITELISRANNKDESSLFNVIVTAFYMGAAVGYKIGR